MEFLDDKYARLLTIVLLLQAAAFYAVARRPEAVPNVVPLVRFPALIGEWRMLQDFPIEKEVQDVLRADDFLSRRYINAAGNRDLSLLIVFFKAQRTGQSPHSPKNCFPVSGWDQISADRPLVNVPDWPSSIRINRYFVGRGTDKGVVLYWYQSHNRVIASEFTAKFWLVADAIRYHRSDTALVRILVRLQDGDFESATGMGIAFVQEVFPFLLHQFPQ